MSARFIFCDTETTGFDPTRDEVWDAAWVFDSEGAIVERQFYVEHRTMPSAWTLANTDYAKVWCPPLLQKHEPHTRKVSTIRSVVTRLALDATLLAGPNHEHDVFFVGAVPTFDFSFLRRHLNDWPFSHRLICVETLVMGCLGLQEPLPLARLRFALGLPGKHEAAHSALGDARETREIFHAARALGELAKAKVPA